jgi:hypothetical protein
MGLKRGRTTPHYIGGLGDGNVKLVNNPQNAAVQDWTVHVRRKEKDPRLVAQEHPALMSAERFDKYYKELQEASSKNKMMPAHRRRQASPWHFQAWALLLTIILLGAFFLHILSDAQKHNRKTQRRKT